jgi:tripeptidyl-peptidase I
MDISESGTPEIACQASRGGVITTGGGFSGFYPRPSFMNGAQSGYLSLVNARPSLKPAAGYFSQNRGYPDISGLAYNYFVIVNGTGTTLSGTSASSPVVAAFISLVNAKRAQLGKGSVGWFNPALYKMNRNFTVDVVSGSNECTSDMVCCAEGFHAAQGWDAVTGTI